MLLKLYSQTDLLVENIEFKSGLNIIFGKSSGSEDATGVNGIGKSTAVRLIDYLLLSSSAAEKFYGKRYDFLRVEDHTISLDLLINDQPFTITRSFDSDSTVKFGPQGGSMVNYSPAELRVVFANKFFPVPSEYVLYKGGRYRTLMNFFVKDDLKNQTRIDPLKFFAHQYSKVTKLIYNFFLLGIPNRNIILYHDLSKKRKSLGDALAALKTSLEERTGNSVEEYKTEKIKIERSVQTLTEAIHKKNFLEMYKEVEDDLLVVTKKINKALSVYTEISKKLARLRSAYEINPQIDTEAVKSLYASFSEELGDFVKRKLDDVVLFQRDLVESRKKFLSSKEQEFQEKLDALSGEITSLEIERNKLYALLDEKGALDSLENAYEELTEKKLSLESSSSILTDILELERQINTLNAKVSDSRRMAVDDLLSTEDMKENLRGMYEEIISEAVFLGEGDSHAYFDISNSSSGSLTTTPSDIDVQIPKADSLGQERLKILAYDLLVFLHAFETSRVLPSFLIHDGVFHGVSSDIKLNILNYVYKKSFNYPSMQYITTFNEDEVAFNTAQRERLEFDISERIVLELTDSPSRTLFKRLF